MLYELIIVAIVVIFAGFSQYMTLKAVKFGMKMGQNPEKAVNEPVFTIPKKNPPQAPEVSDEMRKFFDVMDNIDAFDGFEGGQKEIEE